jgi:hypothetical protein
MSSGLKSFGLTSHGFNLGNTRRLKSHVVEERLYIETV